MSPFFDAISAGVSGTPGTGSITIGTVTSGFRAFSNVPANTLLNYRVQDGTDWEIGSGLWNGTTLTRTLQYSSTGSLLSLSSSAVVSLPIPADEVQPHIGGGKWGMLNAAFNTATIQQFGLSIPSAYVATTAVSTLATTNYLTRQHRVLSTSSTTASSLSGIRLQSAGVFRSATAFMGGFEYVARFGASLLPTGPRLVVGLVPNVTIGSVEPSTLFNMAALAKDSTDTNIQFMLNDGAGAATKTDTGIPLVAGGWYEAAVWCAPGDGTVFGSLARIDTGATWFGSGNTNIPTADVLLCGQVCGGLNATNTGTAFEMNIGSVYQRTGF